MKALLLTVSHKQPDWVLQACADYERRLPRSWGFRVLEVKPDARNAGAEATRVQAAEAKRLRAAVPEGARSIALDERGEPWSTRELAARFAKWLHEPRDVAFAVGGADGLDPGFRAEADHVLSLSRLTLPHGLVRVLMVEQLYRVATLLQGHPYHK
jgi:23S rRNA (pseudouridine1915-N3)-methyltransferase